MLKLLENYEKLEMLEKSFAQFNLNINNKLDQPFCDILKIKCSKSYFKIAADADSLQKKVN